MQNQGDFINIEEEDEGPTGSNSDSDDDAPNRRRRWRQEDFKIDTEMIAEDMIQLESGLKEDSYWAPA